MARMILELCDRTLQPRRRGIAGRECLGGGMSVSAGHSCCLELEAWFAGTLFGQWPFVS